MNPEIDHEQDVDQAIDDALRTYPLAPAPPSITLNVMARLRNLPPEARPRFRLGWFDYAMGLFTTSLAGVGFVLWQSIPPLLVARLQVEWLILLQRLAQIAPHLPPLGGG